MNERIRQLATSAGMVMYPTGLGISENTLWGDRNIERFARLIVKECIGTVEGTLPGYQDYRNQIEDAFRRDCVEQIKHKFGVEL